MCALYSVLYCVLSLESCRRSSSITNVEPLSAPLEMESWQKPLSRHVAALRAKKKKQKGKAFLKLELLHTTHKKKHRVTHHYL